MPIFSVTLVPKIIVIDTSHVCQNYSKSKGGTFFETRCICNQDNKYSCNVNSKMDIAM